MVQSNSLELEPSVRLIRAGRKGQTWRYTRLDGERGKRERGSVLALISHRHRSITFAATIKGVQAWQVVLARKERALFDLASNNTID